MIVPLLLWALATLDNTFAGFRAAAGRSALIDKRRYYVRAMAIGALYGQGTVAVVGGLVAALLPTHPQMWNALMLAGARLLTVLVPYAAIILLAFAVRAIPSIDIKCISSVIVFGPCVLLHPWISIGAVLYARLSLPRDAPLDVICAVVVILMVTNECVLNAIVTRPGVQAFLTARPAS